MDKRRRLSHLPERFPYSCQWEITCRCNLHCVMCYTDCFNRPDRIRKELPTPDILRIMDELADAGCLELCLTGGEPLARPDFFDIYEHAVRKGFLVTIFTNGTLLDQAAADRFALLPPYRIEMSVHGLTEHTFESITRGRGSYQRCKDAIDLLLERHLPLVLKTTAMTLNKHEVLLIKLYANSLEVVRYKLGEEMRPTLDHDTAPLGLGLSHEELRELNQQDERLRREAHLKDTAPTPPCRSGMRSFHIDAYGHLQLCSGNRAHSYDLLGGTFEEGFYKYLPTFACEWNTPSLTVQVQPTVIHA